MKLSKEIFGIGIGIIISVIGENTSKTISNKESMKVVYDLLSDLNPDYFIPGIKLMIQKENILYFPSIALIRKYVEQLSNFGYTKEELIDLAKVRKLTKKPFSNKDFDNFIQNINIEKSLSSNSLVFKNIQENTLINNGNERSN